MAPLSRAMHLGGSGVFAVLYGLVRASLLFVVVALFFHLSMPDANFAAALAILLIASVSFFGIGMMTAVLPLISPEKGAQLGFVAQGLLLVVSGVYYPVSVLPEWMQWVSKISPATYALRGIRGSILERPGPPLGERVAAARDRRRLDPARPLGVQQRRDLREAARQAEAVGLGARGAGARPASRAPSSPARARPGSELCAICAFRVRGHPCPARRVALSSPCTEHGAPEVEGLPSD